MKNNIGKHAQVKHLPLTCIYIYIYIYVLFTLYFQEAHSL